ncbi:MAG TPA: cell division protein FtsZ [Terriglobia bacterium]|nr:cell division protein FtsZ [Terriglobia bacterium]
MAEFDDEGGLRLDFSDENVHGARIKVIGVGGGGGNAVNRMIAAQLEGVEFMVANTDLQALGVSQAPVKIQLGAKLTKGLGAGANPDVGRRAALEDTEKIIESLEGADMVFITAGLGGGTGTGGAPIVAGLARELGALTVAVVTKPFAFEGKRRMMQAEQGLAELSEHVDTVICIPNERLMQFVDKGTSFFEAFRIADDILRQGVQGISDIITITGIINRDFADIKTIMEGMGYAVMGTATASGEGRAVSATRQAIESPLLEDASINGAHGILLNLTGSSHLTLHEVHEASTIVQQAAAENANIIFGAVLDESMGDAVKVTVIATGIKSEKMGLSRPPSVTMAAKNVQQSLRNAVQKKWEKPAAPPVEPAPAPVEAIPEAPADDLEIPAYLRRRKVEGLP